MPGPSGTPELIGSWIHTPDRRVRVFISSTIEELAAERLAAREAIERLRQAPVFFESGARPYPARAVYRQMLEQCDIFVGIYWQSYGWAAVDMEVSGLEDEYELSEGKPRLIYIKTPAPERQPRLAALLARIREAGDVSYRKFESPKQLGELIVDDLALLLAERFSSKTAGLEKRHVHTLPNAVTPIVGRHDAVETVEALLRREGVRLLTLTGTGGVGKTRLALEVGRRVATEFAHGAVFVDLASVSNPDDVPRSIIRALGLIADPSKSSEALLCAYLSDKELLVVLDNFEQVLGAAPIVTVLLANSSRLKILVTSRAPLRTSGEQLFHVEPMEIPELSPLPTIDELTRTDAIVFFIDRARASRPDFALDEANAQAVAEICVRLDGLPLAIELAAARMIVFREPSALLARLQKRLPLLTRGRRDAPERQLTMHNAIGWSYDLLSDDEQTLFRRLGVFVGGRSTEGPEAIASAGMPFDATITVLESLVEASLLLAEPSPDGDTRFRMLETIREYALERLEAKEEQLHIRTAHTEYFVGWLHETEPSISGPNQQQTLARIEVELPNLHAAIEQCEASGDFARGFELVGMLWRYWYYRGLIGEGRSRLKRVLPHANGVSDYFLARVLEGGAGLAYAQGDFQEALDLFQKSYELYYHIKDKVREYRVLGALGSTLEEQGQYQEAKKSLEDSLSQLKLLDDTSGVAATLNNLGRWELEHGDLDRAASLLTEARTAYLAVGDQIGLSQSILNYGVVEESRGNFQAADKAFQEADAIGRDMCMPAVIASALHNRANIARDSGNYREAERLIRESLELKRKLGNLRDIATTLNSLGNLAADMERFDLALECFEEIVTIAENVGDVQCTVWGLSGKGTVKEAQGARDEATALFEEALQLSRNANYLVGVAMSLNNKIVVAPTNMAESMSIYGESLRIFASLKNPSGSATVQQNLGRLAMRQGDFGTALALFQSALGIFSGRGERLHVISCLEEIGNCLGVHGRLIDTTHLYSVAHRVREVAGVSVAPHVRSGYEGRQNQLKDPLGSEAFALHWNAGTEWPLAEAVAYALQVRL